MIIKIISAIEDILHNMLNCNSMFPREDGPAMLVKELSISQDKGIVLKGIITEPNQKGLHNNYIEGSPQEVTILKPGLLGDERLSQIRSYINNRPRLRVVKYSHMTSSGEVIVENAFSVVGKTGNTSEISYKQYHLFDLQGKISEQSKGIYEGSSGDLEYENWTRINCFQKKFDSKADRAAVALAFSGYRTGILLKNNAVYGVDELNGKTKSPIDTIRDTITLKNNVLDNGNSSKISLESLGCLNKTTNAAGISFIETSGIIEMKDIKNKLDGYIRDTRDATGIVVCKSSTPEDILEVFFRDNYRDRSSIHLGCMISEQTLIKNSIPNLIMIDSTTGVEAKSSTGRDRGEQLTLGQICVNNAKRLKGSCDFYIIDETSVDVEPELIIELSKVSLVFIIKDFKDLSGLADLMKYQEILDKVLLICGIRTSEIIKMHDMLKRFYEDNELDLLKKVPLEVSKVTTLGKTEYSKLLQVILLTSAKRSNNKFPDKMVMNNQLKIYGASDIPDIHFTDGELFRVAMELSREDLFKENQTSTVVRLKITKDFNIPLLLSVQKQECQGLQYKMVVNVIDTQATIDITKPLEMGGITYLCGDIGVGKIMCLKGICRNLPVDKSVLVIDNNYSIVKECFQTGMDISFIRHTTPKAIEDGLRLKPDIVIVYKLDKQEVVNTLFKYYRPGEHTYILVADKLFKDVVKDYGHLDRIITDLKSAYNIIKVKINTQDGVSSERLIEEISGKMLLDLSETESEDIIASVTSIVNLSPSGLLGQLSVRASRHEIDQSTFVIYNSRLGGMTQWKSKNI